MTTAQSTINQTGSASDYALKYNANVPQTKTTFPEISVVIPVFNEEDNIAILYQKLCQALDSLGRTWEAIIIADGFSDTSYAKLASIAAAAERIKVVLFFKKFRLIAST